MGRKKSASKSNQFAIAKPNAWGPEIEVRRKDPIGEPGKLEAVFLGSDAEAAARAWIEKLWASGRKGSRQEIDDRSVSGRITMMRLRR